MMDKTLEKVVEYLSATHNPLKIRELSRKLGIKPAEYRNFRRMIKDAVDEGILVRGRGGKLTVSHKEDFYTGKLFVSRAGHGFVIADQEMEDIFVSQRDLGSAIHGEKVEVVLKPLTRSRSREGKIVRVLEREKGRIVGKVLTSRYGMSLRPTDPRFPEKIEIENPRKLAVKKDMIVSVRLYPWEASYLPPRGHIEEVLGMEGSPGVDIDSLIISHGLSSEFDKRVRPELTAIKKAVTKASLTNRLDLRNLTVVTIDPADAKDHDDAVSIEDNGNDRFRLGVHIADVSHFVKYESALDSEALLRGNSVYLVDRVLPMLPEKLSADICSLHEKKDRLTVSFLAEIDTDCNVYEWEFRESVIASSASLNYEQVQDYLDGRGGSSINGNIGSTLKKLRPIARALREKRLKNGSLDFDLPEPKVVLDARGRVLDIFTPKRLESHQIIEELMLLANRHAAIFLQGAGAPALFRVHAKPDKEKIENFVELMKEMGFKFSFKGEITPIKLQRVLNAVKDKPEEQFVEEILLRSLAKAAYQPENIGHFGLAFSNYVHFTSPIRRYPDLLIHRILKMLLNKRLGPNMVSSLKATLKKIGQHCTETEMAADQAERESLKIKQLEYLQERVGGIYDGIISGVIRAGLFVELQGSMVEGFIPFSTINDDYFTLDEGKFRAIGKRSKKMFKLGDRIRIIVVKVDLENRRADFVIADNRENKLERSAKRRRSRK
ncbi:MAG: ribonuclease R [Candidatus Zixiibacteriota bacterium]|nr:MAG: ribonuclease R [candidate division Zixibacteria bacterium]